MMEIIRKAGQMVGFFACYATEIPALRLEKAIFNSLLMKMK